MQLLLARYIGAVLTTCGGGGPTTSHHRGEEARSFHIKPPPSRRFNLGWPNVIMWYRALLFDVKMPLPFLAFFSSIFGLCLGLLTLTVDLV
jgi:hypothetical protein